MEHTALEKEWKLSVHYCKNTVLGFLEAAARGRALG